MALVSLCIPSNQLYRSTFKRLEAQAGSGRRIRFGGTSESKRRSGRFLERNGRCAKLPNSRSSGTAPNHRSPWFVAGERRGLSRCTQDRSIPRSGPTTGEVASSSRARTAEALGAILADAGKWQSLLTFFGHWNPRGVRRRVDEASSCDRGRPGARSLARLMSARGMDMRNSGHRRLSSCRVILWKSSRQNGICRTLRKNQITSDTDFGAACGTSQFA